jgi:hypothetical protein
VPLVGFSWICEASRAPRLHGHAPLGKHAEFDAAAIELADDLKRVSLTHIALAFSTPAFPVRVHAEHATLRGLPPWGRSRRMPFAWRAGLFVLSVSLAAYGVGRLAARTAWLPLWGGALLGVFVSGCSWFAFAWLERHEPRPLSYLVLPGSGALGLAAAALALFLGQRAWLRWAGPARPSAVPENPQ